MPRWVLLLLLALSAGCGGPARVSGNRALSERELLAAAQRPITAWEKQGRRPADLADAAEAMRSALAEAGFAEAQVDFQAGEKAHFLVTEGARVAVGRIEFSGARHLDRKVRQGLEQGLRPWYVAGLVESAAAHLEQEYRRIGFITARVSTPQLAWNADRSQVDVTFPVKEGLRYTIASETVEFTEKAPEGAEAALTALLDPPGTVYDLRLGARTAARLRSWLTSRGYTATTVAVTEQLDPTTGTAAPIFRVSPGTLQRLGTLSLRFASSDGRGRTSRRFALRRLAALKPGQPIDQSVVDGARAGLYSTGLFTGVRMIATPAGQPGLTDLEVELGEAKTRRFDLSLGYGSYEQLRGGIEYVDDHLFGHGLRLHSGVNGSLKGWGAELGLAAPFSFGRGRTLGTDLSYREREEPSFSHREFTGTLDAAQRFRPDFDDARWEVRNQYEYKLAQDFDVAGALGGSEIDGYYRSSTLSARLRRDSRRPRAVDPQRGTLVQLSAGWNTKLLGSDVPYTELGGEWSGYLRLHRSLVASLRCGGTIRNPTDEQSLPIGERLFLGGEDSVRSFTRDQLGPADASGDPIGGLSRGVANAEVRWRPWRSWPNAELAGFYDLGGIGQRPWTLDSPPGQGVGGGMRYHTPVGPIRLDAAYNPGERFSANDVYAVHLAVGFAF